MLPAKFMQTTEPDRKSNRAQSFFYVFITLQIIPTPSKKRGKEIRPEKGERRRKIEFSRKHFLRRQKIFFGWRNGADANARRDSIKYLQLPVNATE